MAQKQVMDMRPGKGFTEAQSNEHKRNWDDKKWGHAARYGNYDRSREHLNFEIVGGKIVPVDKQKSIPTRIKEILDGREIKDPNEGKPEPTYRTAVNIIFGGSRERMHQIAFGGQTVNLNKDADNSAITRSADIERWAMDVYRFAADHWGEENIASCIVHLDETNPHLHLTLLPIVGRKFSYKKMFAGQNLYDYQAKMRQLHDEFAEVMRPWGLERGTDVAKTGARNIPPEEYRRLLSQECDDLQNAIEARKKLLAQLQADAKRAEIRVKGLATMIRNLEDQSEELASKIAQLQADLRAGNGDKAELEEALKAAESRHEQMLQDLNDKQRKLFTASHTLAQYRHLSEDAQREAAQHRAQASEWRQRAEYYRQELATAANDIAEQYRFRAANAMLLDLIADIKSAYPNPDYAPTEMLQTLAANGNEIIQCAAMLLAGYVDGATRFAESHGGGGSAPDSGWGRKDDEDDRQWARRCLAKAIQMMRPAPRRGMRR